MLSERFAMDTRSKRKSSPREGADKRPASSRAAWPLTPERRCPPESLWSAHEAAAFLRMSERWLRNSTVPKIRLPGKTGSPRAVRYDPEEVRAWAKQHLTHSVDRRRR